MIKEGWQELNIEGMDVDTRGKSAIQSVIPESKDGQIDTHRLYTGMR